MTKRNVLTRFDAFYRKHGLLRTLQRFYEQRYRIMKRQTILYYVDMADLCDTELNLPEDVTIECKTCYEEASQPDMQRMVRHWDEERLTARIKERFQMGAVLWILKVHGDIAGFVWSIKGKFVAPYFVPLTPEDAVIFDVATFEEFRGQGLYSSLLNRVLRQLKLAQIRRAFTHVHEWNKPSIRGHEKTPFHEFAQARMFNVLGRRLVAFSDTRKGM